MSFLAVWREATHRKQALSHGGVVVHGFLAQRCSKLVNAVVRPILHRVTNGLDAHRADLGVGDGGWGEVRRAAALIRMVRDQGCHVLWSAGGRASPAAVETKACTPYETAAVRHGPKSLVKRGGAY
jgi:hypothetical protein